MNDIDRLNVLAEENAVTFTYHKLKYVVVEANDDGIYAKPVGMENDPYAGENFRWDDMPFTAAELLAKFEVE